MRILQLIQRKQLRGAEIFASQLSDHLQKAGHEVMLVSLFPGAADLPFSGTTRCLDASESARFWDFRAWRRLYQLIRSFKPDIIQSNAGDTLKFAVLSKVFFFWKTPIVFRNANKVSDFIKSPLKRALNAFFVRRLSYVVSVSEVCRQDFIGLYDFPAAQTTMIPIGIELSRTESALPGDVRHHFSGARVIMNVASLVPEKNHERLLVMMKAIAETMPDVRLLIAGDGRLRAHLASLIDQWGLGDRVVLLGYRKDVLSILPHAQAFVLPSRIEGLPGVILEAFLCRVPVVAYHVGGIGEVLSTEHTGWLVPRNNEDMFLNALTQALSPSGERDAKVAEAYRLVTTTFTNAELAQRFENVYKNILQVKQS